MGKKKYSSYEDHFQHIEDVKARVSALLEVRMLEKELRSLDGDTEDGSSVRKKLASARRKLTVLSRKLEGRVSATLRLGEVDLPLQMMCSQAGLSGLEARVLEFVFCSRAYDELSCLACQLLETRSITVKTVIDVIGGSLKEKAELRKLIRPENALFSSGLIILDRWNGAVTEGDFLDIKLKISYRTYSTLMGLEAGNPILEPYSEIVTEWIPVEDLVFPEELKKNVMTIVKSRGSHSDIWEDWGLQQIREFRKGTVIVLSGPDGSGRRTLGCSLAGEMGLPCLHVRMDRILDDGDYPVDVFKEIIPEAEYQGALALVTDADHLFSGRNSSQLDIFRKSVVEHDGITVLTVGKELDPSEFLEDCLIWRVEIPLPDKEQREELWERLLPEELPLLEDTDLSRIALQHEMTPGDIREAIIGASLLAIADGRTNEGISHTELEECCLIREKNSQVAGRMRRRMMVPFKRRENRDSDGQDGFFDTGWGSISLKDVILPSRTRRQVTDIIAAADHQEKVFEEWGFGDLAGSGHSISALFKGESGTGKTMTAEAIAYELGRKLSTVRGSALISKWVGESEKNVVRVFRETGDNEVIFFDEAEAIFTSRVEINDAHSEMINRRVSCLLREIEMFNGVIILATNYSGLIDKAFQRRIRFKVDFPRPDRKAREAIWRVNVPEQVPLADDVDFALLAEEYDHTGGQIRGIILRAAFAAANRGGVVDMELIMQAAEDEVPFVRRMEIGFAREKEMH